MRLRLFLLSALFFAGTLCAFAQRADRIKSDPETIWASGRGATSSEADKAALEALLARLSRYVDFPDHPGREYSLMATFREDVRRCSHRMSDGAAVLRYLSESEVPLIFEARRRKVDELEETGDRTGKAVYYEWAEVELSSLPGRHAERLRLLSQKRETAPDRNPVDIRALRMEHLEREVRRIRSAFQSVPASLEMSAAKVPEPEIPSVDTLLRPEREPLGQILPAPQCGVAFPEIPFHPAFRAAPFPVERPDAGGRHDRVFLLAGAGFLPEMSAGLAGAFCRDRWGMYASVYGNFVASAASYACRRDGSAGDRYIWPTGASRVSSLQMSAGVCRKVMPGLAVTAGAGWGRRAVLWEDSAGAWAYVEDLSVQGPVLESGLIGWRGALCGSIGLSTVAFRTLGVKIGVGVSF